MKTLTRNEETLLQFLHNQKAFDFNSSVSIETIQCQLGWNWFKSRFISHRIATLKENKVYYEISQDNRNFNTN